MEHVVRFEAVSKVFGSQTIIDEVTLDVPAGCIFGLLGPSGAGKTTMVKMIAGLERPTRGIVSVLGERTPKPALQQRIGYMAQSDALYADLTAAQNLSFFSSLYGLRGERQKTRIRAAMELVGLSEDKDKRVGLFSGGMKRRLSLAVAMLHEPELLILDEPTVGIDPLLRLHIWEQLQRIRHDGTSIVMTTHVMDEADKCDTLAMLRGGAIIAVGSPAELKAGTATGTLEGIFLTTGGSTR